MTTAKLYIVTIIPKYKGCCVRKIIVEQFANNCAQAIKYAYQEYNEKVADDLATFTAKLAD